MDDEDNKRPAIAELRGRLMDGLIPFSDFAAAMGRHPKSVMKLNPPVVRIGRNVFVPEEEGRAWLLNGCKPVDAERRRGRRRAA